MKTLITAAVILCASLTLNAGDRHTITDVEDDIIILDDGTTYQSLDPSSSIWLPFSDVIVTDDGDKIINIDEHESVDVIPIN